MPNRNISNLPDPRYPQQQGASPYVPANASKPRKKRTGWRIVFWLSLLIFLVAVGALAYIGWGYFSSDKGYKDVADQAFVVSDATSESSSEEDVLSLGDLEVDWEYLRSVNPDVVAWVYVPGTRINYPVVHAQDNEKYLNIDFNLTTSRNGAIFLDASNSPAFTDMNNVLYGHHMNDGSMFACISEDFIVNEEFNKHRSVYVLTPSLNYKCTSFAVVLTTGSDLLVQTSFANNEERASYIQDKIDRSAVTPSEGMPKVDDVKQLFTLSTCDYTQSDGRAVLFTYVVDTAAPASAPDLHEEVAAEDLAALEEGVSVAAD